MIYLKYSHIIKHTVNLEFKIRQTLFDLSQLCVFCNGIAFLKLKVSFTFYRSNRNEINNVSFGQKIKFNHSLQHFEYHQLV